MNIMINILEIFSFLMYKHSPQDIFTNKYIELKLKGLRNKLALHLKVRKSNRCRKQMYGTFIYL